MWEIDRTNNKLVSMFVIDGETKVLPAMIESFPKARSFFFNDEITLYVREDKNMGLAVFIHK